MEIVARTKTGYLLQAKGSEIQEILNAVTGTKPKDLVIGQKIPAIDYATTITKIKSLKEDYLFIQLFERIKSFHESTERLEAAVVNASKLEV